MITVTDLLLAAILITLIVVAAADGITF